MLKNYWQCNVKVSTEDDRGKVKWRTEVYLVNAVNPTDCEIQITGLFKDYVGDWKIHSVTKSKIFEIIDNQK